MSRSKSLRNRKRMVPRVEGLEGRLTLTTTAFLGVLPAVGGLDASPGSVVRVIGENDTTAAETSGSTIETDRIELRTIDSADGFSGHVSVTLLNVDVPGRRLFGAFDVDALQATAQLTGGNFLGFKVYGLAGNDTINASGLKNFERTELNGNDVPNLRAVYGLPLDDANVSDNDKIIGGELSRDRYDGGRGNDTITNVDIYDTIPAVPNIPGHPFIRQINGGPGDDTLEFRTPNPPSTDGITLNNTISDLSFVKITMTGNADNVDLTGAPNGVELLAGAGNDNVIGSANNDTIHGGAGNDTVNAGAGNDVVNGDEGDDTLNGEDGDDTVNGGAGNDSMTGGNGNDQLNGGDGNDSMYGGAGNDALNGGAGEDLADYSASTGPVYASLAVGSTVSSNVDPGFLTAGANDGDGGTDTYSGVENLRGSVQADYLEGNGDANKIWGGNGDDSIRGGAGDDTLDGEGGRDLIDGEAGNDTVKGGANRDTLLGGTGNDMLDGGNNDDVLFGEEGQDRLLGGLGNDTLDGGLGFDQIEAEISTGDSDIVITNYDYDRGAIQDWLLKAGAGWEDEFRVQTIKFLAQTNANWFLPEQQLDGDKQMDLVRRLDAQFELAHPMGDPNNNSFGARDLIFSDFDGGDGLFGDQLTFVNPA